MNRNILLDAGGALLFLFGFHLIIGNFFIGLAEYYFVKKVFKVNLNLRGLFLIVAGNYLSLIAGLYGSLIFNSSESNNTFNAMLGPLTVTLVVSILLEWPFFYKAMIKVVPNMSIRKTFTITAYSQLFSYVLMILYYFVTQTTEIF